MCIAAAKPEAHFFQLSKPPIRTKSNTAALGLFCSQIALSLILEQGEELKLSLPLKFNRGLSYCSIDKSDGVVERKHKYTEELAPIHHSRMAGIDYTEAFSPVVKMTTVRALIATTFKKGWSISQLDVNNAFLHGDLNEELYMQVLSRLVVNKPGLVIGQLKAFLHEQFKIKDLGQLHYFLGLEVMYKDDGAIISQRKFVLDLLKEYNFLDHSSCSSPLDPTIKLKARECTILQDPTYYRKLVGKLNFLTNTRLDIAYSVQHLSQFMKEPKETHLKVAFHLLRYLKSDPTLGIFMSKDTDHIVRAYCDSDWAACPDSKRSITGYLVLLGNSPIS
uniref:Uncharacterized mitochondrial protein AtMg00810-like n=1 Tax=Nicotiana tabacum TaxID=4097 RepID=A0A1S3YJ05_TOBAC|nr:PREDICTED: uncharacterized mitochondrial protein AtMg00810-like [Nicotiana tabacum]